MPYIDQDLLENLYSVEEVAALCPTAEKLAQTIELAEAETETALLNGGYPSAVPSSVYASVAECPKAIRLLAFGAWVELVHGLKSIDVPEGFATYVKKLDLVRNGKMELPGLSKGGVAKDVGRAVGGVMSTETSTSVTDSRPAVFPRKAFREGGF